jgi:hypothetical protein
MCCASRDVAAGQSYAGTDRSGALSFPVWRALTVNDAGATSR